MTRPGAACRPSDLDRERPEWYPAEVPGTTAGAIRLPSVTTGAGNDYDAVDSWFRCRFDALPDAPARVLTLHGLATIADVWLNGEHLLHSENMFRSHRVVLQHVDATNELAIRFAALEPLLACKRARPRWKTYMVRDQNLRWYRTTLLGRIPGWAATPPPSGPWKPVEVAVAPVHVVDRHVAARCDGAAGLVDVRVRLLAPGLVATEATVSIGATRARLPAVTRGDEIEVTGTITVPSAKRWWPHTHGDQPLYDVSLRIGDVDIALARVGFRTVAVDRSAGGFEFLVNDVPVFCRGACWFPPDATTLAAPDDVVRSTLELARAANMNMVRVPGTTVYPDDRFLRHCDELGLLVWQDCMFAFLDPPDDECFVRDVEEELRENLGRLAGHPCVALVCGGQEIEEIPAMMGLSRSRWTFPLFEETIPALAAEAVPGVPYLVSNPSGGPLPFQMDTGVSHYFGVGGYLRSIGDVRRDGVRFASECLAFATPPEPSVVDDRCGGATSAGHDPHWKQSVHHDAGRSWDMEDVRAFYMRELFGVDPLMERYVDPERALDLGRATNAELVYQVFSEWRRPASPCAGGLVLALRDLNVGAGWGLIDATGLPKAPWYALRRALAPVAVLVTDEGLNGLRVHLVNDTAKPFGGCLDVSLFARGELCVERVKRAVIIPPRRSVVHDLVEFFDGFRDVSYAYRFSPPAHDVVAVALIAEGHVVSEVVHLPLGLARSLEPDVGLAATASPGTNGSWLLDVGTRRLAEFVAVDARGFRPSDSWFHLVPGTTRRIVLDPFPGMDPTPPAGTVRALNARAAARITIDGAP